MGPTGVVESDPLSDDSEIDQRERCAGLSEGRQSLATKRRVAAGGEQPKHIFEREEINRDFIEKTESALVAGVDREMLKYERDEICDDQPGDERVESSSCRMAVIDAK